MDVAERLAEVDGLLDRARYLFSLSRRLGDEPSMRICAELLAVLHQERCALLPLQRRPHD